MKVENSNFEECRVSDTQSILPNIDIEKYHHNFARNLMGCAIDIHVVFTPIGDIMSVTMKNLETALAGESMAHIKYRYFAKLAREAGFEDVAAHFEHTANQEIIHAWSHLELLVGKPGVVESLRMAIDGETHEYTQMYPTMKSQAEHEKNFTAAQEAAEQIEESKDHARQFAEVLAKAEKRFAALAKVEKRHAEAYQKVMQDVIAKESVNV